MIRRADTRVRPYGIGRNKSVGGDPCVAPKNTRKEAYYADF